MYNPLPQKLQRVEEAGHEEKKKMQREAYPMKTKLIASIIYPVYTKKGLKYEKKK